MEKQRFIISGGGTGGHIFPAISIANAIKAKLPQAEILFVGAENRMEMQRVPAAGYRIVGLPICGFDRKHLLKNVKTLWNLLRSLRLARRIVKDFKPDAAIGVGGYASGPLLRAAASLGVPCYLQEQNSYAGLTNKWLASKAKLICVAYQGMEKFFPADKIVLTGNPVRQDLLKGASLKNEALAHYAMTADKPVLLVVGGSLGAGSIDQAMLAHIDELEAAQVQVLWQTGKYYYDNIQTQLAGKTLKNVQVTQFVDRMDYAYAMADLVVSRAGASSISELCLLGKACVLVPSPNVAEDHQTKNAMALVNEQAAVMLRDVEVKDKLVPTALQLLKDEAALQALRQHILRLALPDSAEKIADIVIEG
ncbi:MAG: undecaprenyldiphospho-muramoylpentapeptide beta-N-acetylglucosaminyltransferase [Bacteroidales bacterium]|nr:undecaprenyldiphospho-muramoylpentapeptide beta-N-acetylglucosaminyltransferase [Bacteroidales bacterium]